MFNNPRSPITFIICLVGITIFFAIELLVALLPEYNTGVYFLIIQKTEGCEGVKEYYSFQYACLLGTAIIMAGFGTIIGLSCTKKPFNLAKTLDYSRISVKFIAKFILTIVMTVIPLVIFMNPLWNRIQTSDIGKTMIKWACQNCAFFFATFFIIFLSPLILELLGL